ncbi:TOMM precursor leader peptide-binding protein [Micromonospora sp. CA-240977]|uniref:TOMM precursor leader peptide-binding protein n=1 Tax=Micromonospora sp. CA-240977 TaxID=3239957 RepID=UPI003D938CEB
MGDRRGTQTLLAGTGPVADAVARLLRAYGLRRIPVGTGPDDPPTWTSWPTDPAPAGPAGPLVLVTDGWPIDADNPTAVAPVPPAGTLTVHGEPGELVIGPWHRPGVPGCPSCVHLRRSRAQDHFRVLRARHAARLADGPPAGISELAVAAAADLVAAEVTAMREQRYADLRVAGAVMRLSLDTLGVRSHRFLADPLCPYCGTLPDDGPDRARLDLRSRAKSAPGRYRMRDLRHDLDDLRALFVDPYVGLVRRVERDDEAGFTVARAPLGLRGGDPAVAPVTESGWGRSDNYTSSDLTALLEAVERWGGASPGGSRPTVRAPYRTISSDAIDPRTLGTHDPEAYATPGFPFVPFTEDTVCTWVWAHSFRRNRPVLVPLSVAYWGTALTHPDEPRFVDEISNGCALGSCLEEAILFGLLEVAERDAFLLTWLARLPVPRVVLTSTSDPRTRMLVHRIEETTGAEVTVFDTTVEQGVPCLWAMATHRHPGAGHPALVCAGGAHPDPEQALRQALGELGPIAASVARSAPRHADRIEAMVRDDALVRRMVDHSLLYSHPAVSGRLDFLRGGDRTITLAEMSRRCCLTPQDDLRDDLHALTDRFLSTGLDVLVVNQTTTEHRAAGLSCVKVIVPGTLPMTFGHANRRVHGLERLRTVSARLGYRSSVLTESAINPHPHPFP